MPDARTRAVTFGSLRQIRGTWAPLERHEGAKAEVRVGGGRCGLLVGEPVRYAFGVLTQRYYLVLDGAAVLVPLGTEYRVAKERVRDILTGASMRPPIAVTRGQLSPSGERIPLRQRGPRPPRRGRVRRRSS